MNDHDGWLTYPPKIGNWWVDPFENGYLIVANHRPSAWVRFWQRLLFGWKWHPVRRHD